jgi:catechol 2,3-dioxygenase-like lactoylglutathione lyase family enzyme
MLSECMIAANAGVKDLKQAQSFYEDVLGLKAGQTVGEDDEGGVMYECGGGTMLFVYETPSGGTNQATTASWKVNDLEQAMQELKDKGVEFEDYDLPGLKTENGVATWGENERAAWFKDPDGNIFCLNEM